MLKRIPWVLFYTGTILLLVLLVCYLVKWIEIIFLINYILYVFALLSFSLTWAISLKLSKEIKFISIILSLSGATLWILALLNKIDFEAYWNISFVLIITGLLLALYGKTTRKSFVFIKFAGLISLLNLLSCFYLTGISFFETPAYLIVSLSIHTIITLTGHFRKIEKVKL